MTTTPHENGETNRRQALQAAGATLAAGMASNTASAAQTAGSNRNTAPLGARLQGVQHFGVTVQNMDRAFEFYTQVLGGTEIMRDGDFKGEAIHFTILADQEILARERGIDPRTIGVPDLRGASQRLDVRFVQFENVVIELLQYRDAGQPMGTGDSWAEPRDHMSPAYPRSMHICFYIRDDVDFDRFITDLEAECARRGMTQVKANRTVTVRTEAERQAAPASTHSMKIHEGQSDGWSLIYCKGPEGEQLEFVQVLGPAQRNLPSRWSAADRWSQAGDERSVAGSSRPGRRLGRGQHAGLHPCARHRTYHPASPG
ncbi:VOC family protein [Dankookia sp. P2]|uniref:VOC family protein n=1 Tax=Dankookia sp. P2 TaxID=3423955 RepID=UPI003D6672E4